MSLLLLGNAKRNVSTPNPPSVQVPDWEILRDFNSGTVGNAANGTADGFSSAASRSIYTTEQVFEGSQACKIRRLQGQTPATGFGNYGGVVAFPGDAVQGDTVWLDAMVYFGAEADLSIMRVASKFFRLRRATSTGGGADHIDLYFSSGIRSSFMFQAISEGTTGDVGQSWFPMGAWTDLAKNVWHRITIAWALGAEPQSLGGTGAMRVWRNGALLTNATGMRTLQDPTDKGVAFYCATQWDFPTYDQEVAWYIDRIRIAKNGTPTWALELEGVG